MTMTTIVRNVREVSRECQSHYASHHASIQVLDAARSLQRTFDPRALRCCIDYLLSQPPSTGIRGYRAAVRLDAAFFMLSQYAHRIDKRLRAAQ